MKCPIDDSPLSVSSREGVEIDFCPQCRGVWLDRGELDKIIDRAANVLSATPYADAGAPSRSQAPSPAPAGSGERYDRDERYRDDDRSRKRRKRSFLDDLFDFD